MLRFQKFIPYCFFILINLLSYHSAYAAEQAGKAIAVRGELYAIDGSQSRRLLKMNSPFYQGETIVTGANSSAQLYFSDNSIVALPPQSKFRIDNYHYGENKSAEKDSYVVTLVEGAFRTITGAVAKAESKAYQAKTSVSTIGVRGTFYATELNDQGQMVCVKRGIVSVNNKAGGLNLGDGERYGFAIVPSANKRPEGSDEEPKFLFKYFSDHLYSGQTSNISNGYNGHRMPVLLLDDSYQSDAYLYLDYANRLTPGQVRTLIRNAR